MKKIFTAAIAAGAIAACAQRPETTSTSPAPQPQIAVVRDTGMPAMRGDAHRGMHEMGDDRMQAMMFNGITLSASQKAQIDSIHARHRTEMQGLDPRNNAGDREKMRQMMQAHMAEIRAVLSPDQQVVFDRNMQEMREHRGEPMGAPPRE